MKRDEIEIELHVMDERTRLCLDACEGIAATDLEGIRFAPVLESARFLAGLNDDDDDLFVEMEVDTKDDEDEESSEDDDRGDPDPGLHM